METVTRFKEILEEKQAENVKILEITKVSSLGDFFILATAKNENHLNALIDYLIEFKKPKSIEGFKKDGWVLLDFEDIIVHLFDEDSRLFYNLERLWVDAITV